MIANPMSGELLFTWHSSSTKQLCELYFFFLNLFKYCGFINCSQEALRWPSVGKYKVDVASFESLALSELQVSDVLKFVMYTLDITSERSSCKS